MNNPIDSLREAVIRDAQAQAYEIMQDAIAAGQRLAAEMDARIAQDRSEALAKAEQKAMQEQQRLLASAQGKIQKERLLEREKRIAEVIDAARSALAEYARQPGVGRDLLLKLCVEGATALRSEKVLLVVRPDQRSWVDTPFLLAVQQQSGKRVELSGENLTAIGGVIVTSLDGRERFDNTLDNRLARVIDDVRAMIWTRISHAR
ncbi:MAG: V-type ATP synthase subunit E [Candidatus Latescibacteria bacterium ADurb.Bin168]|nr:MAG: V-type ATP synthase subunit E [Candidatus Latescibacteria bacterium ADurb.Bin168]